jgi:hypothetical protein
MPTGSVLAACRAALDRRDLRRGSCRALTVPDIVYVLGCRCAVTISRLTALLALLVTAFPLTASGGDTGSPRRVLDYREDRLTLHVQEVPLTEVVAEIARQSGAELRGQVYKPREVSAAFEDQPLVPALERLLGEQNFTLRYGRDGQLRMIHLLGQPQAPVAPSTPLGPAAAGLKPTPGSPVGLAGVVAADDWQRPGVPHVSASSKRAGTPGGTGKHGQGGSAILGAPGQANGAAQQAGADQPLTGAELQQRLRRAFLNSLQNMDDATLAAYMDTPEGRRAAALLQFYGAHRLGSTQQEKAVGIIERLPTPPPPRPGH